MSRWRSLTPSSRRQGETNEQVCTSRRAHHGAVVPVRHAVGDRGRYDVAQHWRHLLPRHGRPHHLFARRGQPDLRGLHCDRHGTGRHDGRPALQHHWHSHLPALHVVRPERIRPLPLHLHWHDATRRHWLSARILHTNLPCPALELEHPPVPLRRLPAHLLDRKSTRLNSSHEWI